MIKELNILVNSVITPFVKSKGRALIERIFLNAALYQQDRGSTSGRRL